MAIAPDGELLEGWQLIAGKKTVNCWKASNAPRSGIKAALWGAIGLKRTRSGIKAAFWGAIGLKRPRSPAVGRASGTIGVDLTATAGKEGIFAGMC